ncbi:hypothetical protein KUCAC02_000144, partial [Chaenocephalus aceratus]
VDSSVEDVVAEEKVSQGIKNLEEIKDILHGNISKQEKSTREGLTKGIPKCHFRVGDQVINADLTLIVRTFNQRNDGQAAVIDSYAMTAIWKHTSGRIRVDPMAHSHRGNCDREPSLDVA